jgi:hypothetical protein
MDLGISAAKSPFVDYVMLYIDMVRGPWGGWSGFL